MRSVVRNGDSPAPLPSDLGARLKVHEIEGPIRERQTTFRLSQSAAIDGAAGKVLAVGESDRVTASQFDPLSSQAKCGYRNVPLSLRWLPRLLAVVLDGAQAKEHAAPPQISKSRLWADLIVVIIVVVRQGNSYAHSGSNNESADKERIGADTGRRKCRAVLQAGSLTGRGGSQHDRNLRRRNPC